MEVPGMFELPIFTDFQDQDDFLEVNSMSYQHDSWPVPDVQVTVDELQQPCRSMSMAPLKFVTR
jgi:hypothetical protein